MKNYSSSIQRRKRGTRTEYIARLTYYDKTGKRKGVSKSAATHWDAKRELQDLIDQHVAGGAEVLEARNMTFAAAAAGGSGCVGRFVLCVDRCAGINSCADE